MSPCVVPAIVAMTTTPIAQREIEVVTCSQTPSQRWASPGMSTLPSARFMFAMSLSKNMQMKMIVKAMRKREKKSPAMPSTPVIASGTAAETFSAPVCTFPAAPLSPSHDESSSDSRSCSTSAGRSWRKSRTEPTSGTRKSSAISVAPANVPSTVTAAATPRDSFVFLIRNRTGYSNTSARKIPTNTIRKVSPIAANAASTPSVAATSSTVRIGRINSTRFGPPSVGVLWRLIVRNYECRGGWRSSPRAHEPSRAPRVEPLERFLGVVAERDDMLPRRSARAHTPPATSGVHPA